MQFDPKIWPDLSRLLDRMLDQPENQRERWARSLTGAEAALAPALLSLLQATAGRATGAWFDTLPKLDDPEFVTLMRTDALVEKEGDEIGPYRLVRLLGRGGMGSVWYAQRSDGLVSRGVALKLPLTVGSSRELAARFAREREIVATLVHPHIARLYDAGITATGQGYLALEYAEGRNLDEYCDVHRLDLRARIALFSQVLGAVQYAHGHLVIHRDLKPSNILVTADAQVRLLDFGVAKLLAAEDADGSEAPVEAADLTRLSPAAITLAYASPEQVAGQAVTTATDIYSLGVVLYELLVGVRPYRVKRDSRAALEEAILQADIPLASAIAADEAVAAARGTTLHRLRRQLGGDLDAILLKALSRQPEQRYATAAAFAEDLERHVQGRAVQAHRRSRAYQMRKFIGRNRVGVAAGVAAASALLATAAIALHQAHEAERQARLADAARDHALAAASHREAVEEFMNDLLLEAGRTGKPVSVSDLIARADQLSAREFENNPEARAAVLKTVGEFKVDFDGPDKGLPEIERAQGLLVQSPDKALRASVSCLAALLRGVTADAEDAERVFREVIEDPQTPPVAASECLGDRAQLANYRGDGPAAAMAAQQALAILDAAPQRSPRKYLEFLIYHARALTLSGQPGKADSAYARILRELQRLGRERGTLGNYVRDDRFDAAISSGDLPLALRLVDEILAIAHQDVPDHPPPPLPVYERSLVLADLGRYAQALPGFERAAQLAHSQDRIIEQRALFDAAVALSKLGRRDEAERLYQRGVEAFDAGPSSQGPAGEIAALLTRAKLNLERRRFASAHGLLTQALQVRNAPSAALAAIHRLRALAGLGAGRVDEALLDARAALAESEAQRGDKAFSAWVGQAELVLGKVLRARGDGPGARQAWSGAIEQLSHSVDAEHPALREARSLMRPGGTPESDS
jgi:serine/threonine protein kinase